MGRNPRPGIIIMKWGGGGEKKKKQLFRGRKLYEIHEKDRYTRGVVDYEPGAEVTSSRKKLDVRLKMRPDRKHQGSGQEQVGIPRFKKG